MTPRTLLIVWHSRTGTALQLARSVRSGARAALQDDPADLRSDPGSNAPPQTSCRLALPDGTLPRRVDSAQPMTMRHDATTDATVGIECVHATRVDAQRVCAASAYAFIAPENLGSLSGVMKEFFDRTYYGVLDRVAGRPYAIVVAAGSDGSGAVRQIERIVTGWRLRAVAPPLIVITDAQTPAAIAAPKRVPDDALADARSLGAALAVGLQLGVF